MLTEKERLGSEFSDSFSNFKTKGKPITSQQKKIKKLEMEVQNVSQSVG